MSPAKKKKRVYIKRPRPIAPPNERQLKAFEFYFASGDKRSYKLTADTFGVSVVSIHNWAKKYNWEEALEQRSKELAHKLSQQTTKVFMTTRSMYLAILKKAIVQAVTFDAGGQIISTKIKINNMADFERAIKLSYQLMGHKLPDEENPTEDEQLRGMDKGFVEEVVQELKLILSQKYRRIYNQPELSDEEQAAINRGDS